MSYKKFYEPLPEHQIDYSPIAQGVSNLFTGISDALNRKNKASDQFKYAVDKSVFANDNILMEKNVKSIISMAQSDIKQTGSITPNTRKVIEDNDNMANEMRRQNEHWKIGTDKIENLSKEDPRYYNATLDQNRLNEDAFGKEFDKDFTTRDLKNAVQSIGGPESFIKENFIADFVKTRGEKQLQSNSENPNFKSSTSKSSPFLNLKTGVNEVTDKDAEEVLANPVIKNYGGQYGDFYDYQMDREITSDIKGMKDSGDSRVSWMKGMSDQEIKAELISGRKENIVNKEKYYDRKLGLVKQDLSEAAGIHDEVSRTSKINTRVTKGRYNNDNISTSDEFFNTIGKDQQQSGGEQAESYGTTEVATPSYSAPGSWLFVTQSREGIELELSGGSMFNLGSGKINQVVGTQPIKIKRYTMQVFDKGGKPHQTPATIKDNDDLIKYYETLPKEELAKLETPQIAFVGSVFDRSKVLGDNVTNLMYSLNEELGKAEIANNIEKTASIQARLFKLNKFQDLLEDESVSDDELVNAASNNGITGVRRNYIVKPSSGDIGFINAATDGLDLRNDSKLSPDMVEFRNRVGAAINKAKAPVAAAPTPTKPAPKKQPVTGLKAGELMVIKGGKRFAIPSDQRQEAINQGFKISE